MTTFLRPLLGSRVLHAHCDGCGLHFPIALALPIEDPEQRLTAGEEIPAGECPKCGACAFVIKPATDVWAENAKYPIADWQHEVANDDTRQGYLNWVEHMKESES